MKLWKDAEVVVRDVIRQVFDKESYATKSDIALERLHAYLTCIKVMNDDAMSIIHVSSLNTSTRSSFACCIANDDDDEDDDEACQGFTQQLLPFLNGLVVGWIDVDVDGSLFFCDASGRLACEISLLAGFNPAVHGNSAILLLTRFNFIISSDSTSCYLEVDGFICLVDALSAIDQDKLLDYYRPCTISELQHTLERNMNGSKKIYNVVGIVHAVSPIIPQRNTDKPSFFLCFIRDECTNVMTSVVFQGCNIWWHALVPGSLVIISELKTTVLFLGRANERPILMSLAPKKNIDGRKCRKGTEIHWLSPPPRPLRSKFKRSFHVPSGTRVPPYFTQHPCEHEKGCPCTTVVSVEGTLSRCVHPETATFQLLSGTFLHLSHCAKTISTLGRGLRTGASIRLVHGHPVFLNDLFYGYGPCVFGWFGIQRFSPLAAPYSPIGLQIHSIEKNSIEKRNFLPLRHLFVLNIHDAAWVAEMISNLSQKFSKIYSRRFLVGNAECSVDSNHGVIRGGLVHRILEISGFVPTVRDIYSEFLAHDESCRMVTSRRMCSIMPTISDLKAHAETIARHRAIAGKLLDYDGWKYEQFHSWKSGRSNELRPSTIIGVLSAAPDGRLRLGDDTSTVHVVIPDVMTVHVGHLWFITSFKIVVELAPCTSDMSRTALNAVAHVYVEFFVSDATLIATSRLSKVPSVTATPWFFMIRHITMLRICSSLNNHRNSTEVELEFDADVLIMPLKVIPSQVTSNDGETNAWTLYDTSLRVPCRGITTLHLAEETDCTSNCTIRPPLKKASLRFRGDAARWFSLLVGRHGALFRVKGTRIGLDLGAHPFISIDSSMIIDEIFIDESHVNNHAVDINEIIHLGEDAKSYCSNISKQIISNREPMTVSEAISGRYVSFSPDVYTRSSFCEKENGNLHVAKEADVVSVRGIVVDREMIVNDRALNATVNSTCFSRITIGSGYGIHNLKLRIKEIQSSNLICDNDDVSSSTYLDIYLDLASYAYPLGMLPGSRLRFDRLLRKKAKNGGSYLKFSPATTVKIEHPVNLSSSSSKCTSLFYYHTFQSQLRTPSLLKLNSDPNFSLLTAEIIVTIVEVSHLSIQWHCKRCDRPVIKGGCLLKCAPHHHSLNAKARFVVSDGSTELRVYAYDECFWELLRPPLALRAQLERASKQYGILSFDNAPVFEEPTCGQNYVVISFARLALTACRQVRLLCKRICANVDPNPNDEISSEPYNVANIYLGNVQYPTMTNKRNAIIKAFRITSLDSVSEIRKRLMQLKNI